MIFARRDNLFEGQPAIGGIIIGGGGGSGKDGKSLEFEWKGTQLGIRQEGQADFVYVDLQGAKGADGREVEFLNHADGWLYWRHTGQAQGVGWTKLLDTATLRGENGKSIEMGFENNAICWRYVGDSAWLPLCDIGSISGGSGGGDVDMSILQPLLDAKVDKENGKVLSDNNFSDEEVEKLSILNPDFQHDHGDLSTLEALSVDGTGKLTFNGRLVEVDVAELKQLIDAKPSVNDKATTTTDTWSSTKIQSELDSRSAIGHTHEHLEIDNLYTHVYKKPEVDNLINALSMGFTWKEPVDSVQDLALLNPIKSETRIVANSMIYFYDGSSWVNIGGSALPPMVSSTVDGLMSSADKVKLDNIDENAPKIVYSATEPTAPVNGMIWVVA